MLARRAGAIAALIVAVVVVVFGIRAYLSSQETQALKNYDSNVTQLLENEQQQVGTPFFNSMNSVAGESGQALQAVQAAIYQDAVTAQQNEQTAAGWSVPGQLAAAQRDLLMVLDLRYEAIEKVSNSIMPAVNGSNQQVEDIAYDMGMIYSSDVIYEVYVAPLIEQALTGDGIQVAGTGAGGVSLGGATVYSQRFLPNQSWTTSGYVAGKVTGATPPALGGSVGGGTHGHALTSVLAGTTTLVAGAGNINDITYSKGLTFTIDFTNDGENDEYDVHTDITLTSVSTPTLTARQTTRETLPGQTYQATLVLPSAPPLNVPLRLTATVEKVYGESDTSNNTQSYYVEFKS
ncbi:MAG: hypothetical protein ABSC56_07105 [Solirubrobacteraceae bacterium]